MSFDFRFSRRRLISACAALAVATTAVPAMAADKTRVVASLLAEPASLNPIYDTGLPALNVFYNLFDQLAGIDASGAVVPKLASEWSHSEDLKTWTFTLRDKATFQDGSPVTSDDVLFTYQTAMGDKTSRLGGYLSTVQSIAADGPNKIVFTLKLPYAPFDRQVTLVPIVSKAAYEKLGKDGYAKAPLGSGPYKFKSWAAGDAITLERYDGYWGKAGAYQTVVFTPVPDETTRANSVQSGDVDIALLGPSMVPAVRSSGAVDVVDQQSNRVVYLGFNSTTGWLKDEKVRKALDLAIDRKLLSERLLNGAAQPVGQLVAAVSFGFDPAVTATETDVEKAKELLKEAGYDGTPITLSYPTTGLPQIDQLAQAISFFLEQVGVKTTLDPQEANTYSGSWFTRKLNGLYLFAFAPSVMDADLPFNMLLRSGKQGYNEDKDVDALLDQQIGLADLVARKAALSKISTIVKDKSYYAPLFIDTYTYGVTKGTAWTPRPDGMIVFN